MYPSLTKIKKELFDLKTDHDAWHYDVGRFNIGILPRFCTFANVNTLGEFLFYKNSINVYISETAPNQLTINLLKDIRFKNYDPIMYNTIKTPTGGLLNFSDGRDMPIKHLCALVRYLHRLNDLKAFD